MKRCRRRCAVGCVVVYAVWHCRRRLIYVGSSRNVAGRWRVWLYRLRIVETARRWPGGVFASRRFFEKARGARLRDWKLVILEEMPEGVSDAVLWRSELRHIVRAKTIFGDGCLNVSRIRRAGSEAA